MSSTSDRPEPQYLYLGMTKSTAIAETVELEPGLLVDFGEDGGVVGIERFDDGRVTWRDILLVHAHWSQRNP